MTTAKISAEIGALPETVYDIVSDPTRLHEWDATYSEGTPPRRRDGRMTFEVERRIANRGVPLTCHIVQAERPGQFAFACTGLSGEMVEEHFALTPAEDGSGTLFTRETVVEMMGQDLGVFADSTYVVATTERPVEQAFARLNALLKAPTGPAMAARAPGDANTRGEATGPISQEEPYSAHPKSERVPDRPT